MIPLWTLSAAEMARRIRNGECSSEEVVSACLERIRDVDDQVRAWAFLDPDYALEQARAADAVRREGRVAGALQGVPVAVKDVFDTYDMPTENGTVLHAGYRPTRDATAVARLREAGAVILGKTVTTELAVYAPGKTRNPHDPSRTPGGSSSGSAAAVAAFMAPLALGTQTNGSVIRPAAFCGVWGFKPSHGLISRRGVLRQSRPLDQVGVFARHVDDLALLAEVLMGFDEDDPDTRPRPAPRLLAVAREEPPLPPRFALVKTSRWSEAAPEVHEGLAELAAALDGRCVEQALPASFDQAWDWHRTIMEADLARAFEKEYELGGDRLSPELRAMIERGREVRAVDYNRAVDRIPLLNFMLEDIFERYDAILTPAVAGEAPGIETTGDPVFCTPWTLCGVPSLSAPLLTGAAGLPVGVQMVARRGDDGRLLRTARWLVRELTGTAA